MATAAAKKRPRQGRKSFRKGFRVKGITAAALHKHISALEAQYGRKVTAQEMLTSARPKGSPIHHLFEWDDRVAAEGFRLEKARYLLRAMVVEHYIESTKKTIEVRTHVFSPKEQGYISIRRALTDEERRTELLEQALKELRCWRKTYKDLSELASIFRAIDGLE
jgi:hypothetical protein